MKSNMCEECFALTEECECELDENDFEICYVEDIPMKKNKPRGKWTPNIKKNEKWIDVKSDYKDYR